MWSAREKELANGRITWIAIDAESSPVSYEEVLHLWEQDHEFRGYFIQLLSKSRYDAFRWETPPITTENANRPFEFVMLDSPDLARHPDRTTFAAQFNTAAHGSVIQFKNLGGDAIMVVPCPVSQVDDYSHLAAFIRNAPMSQQNELWKLVGTTMLQCLSSKPVWLSTAGGAVAWLHIRLDDRPKYYGYEPYRLGIGETRR